jgi:hypothetical protein
MTDIEKELELIKEALRAIASGLDPNNSGIARNLDMGLGRIADRLDKIEKKLGLSN